MALFSPEHIAAQQLLDLHQATAAELPQAVPEAELVQGAGLQELRQHTGIRGARILLSFDREIFDVSSKRDIFGPDGSFSMLAGADVTRCLSEMVLESSNLSDLRWEPDNSEEEKQLGEWKKLLRLRYPMVGGLRVETVIRRQQRAAAPADPGVEGLRQRAAGVVGNAAMAQAPPEPPAGGGAACPISGKVGMACPMSMIGIDVKKSSAPSKPAPGSTAGAASGFMAGKSLIATVERQQKLGGNNDSILYKLCPLHADEGTLKVLTAVAAISWVSGAFIGWKLHQQLQN